ncbi:MAG: helix-turn-helix transcriptional regulator [Nisaea sp.]|uniref:helix-turn-helix domain-containing protein n=1 Tax=Nisaea sp. TaxID=2024842 RepID=UPI0032662CB0
MSKPRSAFYDFEPPEVAAVMELRAKLMIALETTIEKHGWTQKVAAEKCGTTQPRISALLNGKFNDFSLDALVAMTGHLNLDLDLNVKERDAA